MKSAPLADVTLALVAEPIVFAAAPEPDNEAFRAALDEATEGQEAPLGALSSEEEDEQEPVIVGNVTYFCPPPQVETIQSAFLDATTIKAQEATESSDGIITPTNGITEISTELALTQLVSPKGSAEAKLELDPNLFDPVAPDLTLDVAATSDAPEAPAAVANAAHGTLVAQLEKRVKNSEKTAENAPLIEQKMPVRELSRRVVAEPSRVESFHADKQTDHLLNAEFEVDPAETIPLKAVDSTRLIETIRTEVSSLRQRGELTMTVVLRPDSGTQISLDVSVGRDGTVHAQARCERGDFQTLNGQWSQLQQSLAAHGIRIADLSNQNHPHQHPQSSPESFHNFERRESSQEREHRDFQNFEEQFNASRGKSQAAKTQSQPASVAYSTRNWQSWA